MNLRPGIKVQFSDLTADVYTHKLFHQPLIDLAFSLLKFLTVLVMALISPSPSTLAQAKICKQFLPWFLTMGPQSFQSLMAFIADDEGGLAEPLPPGGFGVPLTALPGSSPTPWPRQWVLTARSSCPPANTASCESGPGSWLETRSKILSLP